MEVEKEEGPGVMDGRVAKFATYVATRRRFGVDSPFFAAGNVERELLAKQITLEITEEEKNHIVQSEEEQNWYACFLLSIDALATPNLLIKKIAGWKMSKYNYMVRQLNCPIIGCGAKLKGLQDLESHYMSRHTATCSVCSRVFPTTRLLNFHVSETHDSFFQAKVARNYPMYECLVEGCSAKFQSDSSRHQHLVDKHHFPRSFRFHVKKHHASQKQRQRQKAQHPPNSESTSKQSRKNLGRKVRSKQTKASADITPSKPAAALENQSLGASDQGSAMDVDELTTAVSRLNTASEPTLLSFGHRRGRALAFVPNQVRSAGRGRGNSDGQGTLPASTPLS